MKILHIISSLEVGGAQQALCNVLKKLREKGNDHIVAFFHDGPHVKTLKKMGIQTYQITGLFNAFDPIAYGRLRQLIKTLQPDILHTSLWGANIMGRILGYQLNIPVISDLHGNSIDEGTFRNMLDRWTSHIPHHIVAVSDVVNSTYRSHIINKIPSKKLRFKATSSLTTIKNGIDVNATRRQAFHDPLTRSELGLDKDAFVVGTVGRLEPIKSYDILIQALQYAHKKKQPVQLCIVGDGSQYNSLKMLAKQLNLEKQVIFTGLRNDAYRIYPLFDCFALSSQSEGLSIALLEALCFGLPIITTHNSSEHDVITDSVNGFLVPPNNPKALGQKLYYLHQNPNLLETMKQKNLELIRKKFELNKTCQHYLDLYNGKNQYPKRNI